MDKNEPGMVERLHREAVQARREQKDQERALVEAMFREAAERQRQDEERGRALVESIHQAALGQRPELPSSVDARTIHHSELPEAKRGSPLYVEWETYRQQATRLLAEGNAGRHVLIKGVGSLAFGTHTTRRQRQAASGFRASRSLFIKFRNASACCAA